MCLGFGTNGWTFDRAAANSSASEIGIADQPDDSIAWALGYERMLVKIIVCICVFSVPLTGHPANIPNQLCHRTLLVESSTLKHCVGQLSVK